MTQKYKPRDLLKVWLWILFFDILSTFIALNFVEGLQEMNPLHAIWFSQGGIGWFTAIMFSAGVMWLAAWAICKIVNGQDKRNPKRAKRMFYLALWLYAIIHIAVVVNNVRWIIIKI
jgi:heme O synthase-like polyprenyltransferase